MYRVTYTIDVDAGDVIEAAEKALQYMRKAEGPSFTVQESSGKKFSVDLDGLTGVEITELPPDKPICTCGLTPSERNWANDKSGWGS